MISKMILLVGMASDISKKYAYKCKITQEKTESRVPLLLRFGLCGH